jgi:hypothetical protein
VSDPVDGDPLKSADGSEMLAALEEYADRLLLSTGLNTHNALGIASGSQKPPVELENVARALRTGWALDPAEPA